MFTIYEPLLQLPPYCDGCGAIFTTSHAFDCRKGGLVIHCHHEIRDLISDLSSLVWTQTVKEAVVKDGITSDPPNKTLVADIGTRRVWQPQVATLFDTRIIDTNAPARSTVEKATRIPREQLLIPRIKRESEQVTPLVVTFHPDLPHLTRILRDHQCVIDISPRLNG